MNVHFLKRKVQALKYALSPYTSKAKDIVASNPGGYLWERSKKNPDLPGVKERTPIGGNKNLAPSLHGTKLAVVLQEIRDRFGSVDPQLKALAEKALSGKGNLQHQVSQDNTYAKTKAMITRSKLGQQAPGEVAQTAAQPFTPEKHEDLFTAIRDRLAKHSQGGTDNSPGSSDLAARAGELARSYNWHRVGAGLQVDEAVRDYINKVTGDRLKHANEAHRTVHNLFGLGSEQRRQGKVSDATHQAFWDGLRKHVNERAKGANSVYGLSARDLKDDMLHKSIRRLAEAEEHIYGTPGKAPTDPPQVRPSYANYKTAGLKQLGPNAKIAPPTFEKPAYSPTKTGVRVNPRARAAQFKRKTKIDVNQVIKAGDFLKKNGLADPGYGRIYVNQDTGVVWYEGSDGDEREFGNLVQKTLKAIAGVKEVKHEAEYQPKEPKNPGFKKVYPDNGKQYSRVNPRARAAQFRRKFSEGTK